MKRIYINVTRYRNSSITPCLLEDAVKTLYEHGCHLGSFELHIGIDDYGVRIMTACRALGVTAVVKRDIVSGWMITSHNDIGHWLTATCEDYES